LRFAIANKRLIQLAYQGSKRIVEPHDYGIKNGAGWRELDIAKIDALLGSCGNVSRLPRRIAPATQELERSLRSSDLTGVTRRFRDR
jgi:hypothetical protein